MAVPVGALPEGRLSRPNRGLIIGLTVALVVAVGLLAAVLIDDNRASPSRTVRGSGVSTTQTREIGTFTGVELAGANNVTVHVGGAQSVKVTADDNLIDLVTTEVRDGRLVIGNDGNIRARTSMRVAVSVPSLDAVRLSGAGQVTVDGVAGSAFGAELSGAGTVEVSGRVDRLTATLDGSGRVALSDLVARDAVAVLHGTGTIRLHATATLDATLSGTGSIVYSGSPAVTTHKTGTGSISGD